MEKIYNEIDEISKSWAEYENTLYSIKQRIEAMDFSIYTAETQEAKRQELYANAKTDVDVILGNFERHIEELETRIITKSFDQHTMIKEKKAFAEEHGLTISEASGAIKDYVKAAPLGEITSDRNPHRKLYMWELEQSGRKIEPAYAHIMKQNQHQAKTQGLNYVKTRVREVKDASLDKVHMNSGALLVAQVKRQQ